MVVASLEIIIVKTYTRFAVLQCQLNWAKKMHLTDSSILPRKIKPSDVCGYGPLS